MTGQPGRVVIVGAGPAGMALAYLLARRGVGVTVLEMHHDFARAFRGEGLQRSGIDAFRQMGLGEQFDRLPHNEMHFIEGIRQLSARELGLLGINDVAYIKRIVDDGNEGFAVHAADGTRIAVLANRDLAFVMVRQNDMEPVSVH